MKVADLSVEVFERIIADIVERKLSERFNDPDEGLELNDELKEYLESDKEEEFVTFDEIKRGLRERNIL